MSVIPDVQAVSAEVMDLLVSYYFLEKKRTQLVNAKPDSLEALEQRLLINVLYRDLILRLCDMGDESNDNHNLQAVLHSISREPSKAEAVKEVSSRLDKFTALIRALKAEKSQIGTQLEINESKYLLSFEVQEAVRLAVIISDLFNGTRTEYKLVQCNPPLDLRSELAL